MSVTVPQILVGNKRHLKWRKLVSSVSRVRRAADGTRSQAVARIADRTASQQTLVIIAIVLIGLVYYECISLI